MARRRVDGALGKVFRYVQTFRGRSCPLSVTDFHRLRDSLELTLSGSSSDSNYEEPVFSSTSEIEFLIQNGVCKVKINQHTRKIERISDLPGNDRAIHYSFQADLGTFEENIIKKFTEFLRDHRVYLTGRFSCLRSVRPEVTSRNKECEIKADRPVPLHVQSMSETWWGELFGVLALEREDAKHVYHFYPGGFANKDVINDNIIYGGVNTEVEESEPLLAVTDVDQLMREAFVIKCLAVEWLKTLHAVSTHGYVTPQVIRLERIVQIWEDGIKESTERGGSGEHLMEMRRIYKELDKIVYNGSDDFHTAKAGLQYSIDLHGEFIIYHEQGEPWAYHVEGGQLDRLTWPVEGLEKKHVVGPAFDLEVWITFAHTLKTGKRVDRAAKHGRTLHEVCRLLGLDNVYEMRPYLWGMGFRTYIAGACFLPRKEMEPGRDVEDAAVPHFKVKDLVGYIYSNKLSRRCFGSCSVEVVIEGETIYYRPIPPPSGRTSIEDPRLPAECLEMYVGGEGYDPRAITIAAEE